jgi:hypothetical protein
MATITRGTTQDDLIDPNWPATGVTDVIGVLNGTHYPQSKLDGWIPTNLEGKLHLIWSGLQQPAPGEEYIVTYDVAPTTLLKGTDFVKAAFTAAIRVAFTNQTLFPAYVYSTDDTKSLLGIYQSFPKRPFKNPAIIVSTGPATMNRTTLSDNDMLREERDDAGVPISWFAWGQTPVEVKIQIAAITDSDRRKLTDITALFIRHLFTFQLAKFGIGFKQVHIVGETEAEWQGQSLYMNSITIPCYTEFQVRYPIKLVDVIGNINIKQIQAEL